MGKLYQLFGNPLNTFNEPQMVFYLFSKSMEFIGRHFLIVRKIKTYKPDYQTFRSYTD